MFLPELIYSYNNNKNCNIYPRYDYAVVDIKMSTIEVSFANLNR